MNNADAEAHAIDSLLLLCQAAPIQDRAPTMDVADAVVKKRQEKKQSLSKKIRTESFVRENGSDGGVDQKKGSLPSPRIIPLNKKSTKLNKQQSFHKDDKLAKAGFDLKEGKFHLLNTSKITSSQQQGFPDKFDSTLKIVKLETLPFHLFVAFNSGDLGNLRDIIDSVTTETVSFKTDSMDAPKVGRQHFMKFFEVLEEVHPDAYIVSSDMKVIDHKTMTTSIYIKGTKVIASQHEHYVMKPRLVDNMNLTSLSTSDVDKLRELEHTLISQNKPIEIELVGLATFGFEDILLFKTASVNEHDDSVVATDNITVNAIPSLSSSSSSSLSSAIITTTEDDINALATDITYSTVEPNNTPKCIYTIQTTTTTKDSSNKHDKSAPFKKRKNVMSTDYSTTMKSETVDGENSSTTQSNDKSNTVLSINHHTNNENNDDDDDDSKKLAIDRKDADIAKTMKDSFLMQSTSIRPSLINVSDNLNNNNDDDDDDDDVSTSNHTLNPPDGISTTPTSVTPTTSTKLSSLLLSSSSSSSSSSLLTQQPKCPKICEIQLAYHLKSFREAIIIPGL